MPILDGLIDEHEQHAGPNQQQQKGKGIAGATENLQHVKRGILQAFLHRTSTGKMNYIGLDNLPHADAAEDLWRFVATLAIRLCDPRRGAWLFAGWFNTSSVSRALRTKHAVLDTSVLVVSH